MILGASRSELEAALQNGGVRVLPAGQASPPSVFIIPGTPWVEPSVLGGSKQLVRWEIMCVVSAASSVAIADQENLAGLVDAACRTLKQPWGLPTFNTPGFLLLGGLPYIAFRVQIVTII